MRYYIKIGMLLLQTTWSTPKGVNLTLLKAFLWKKNMGSRNTWSAHIYVYIYICNIYIYIYVIYIYIIFHILFHILYILFSIYYFLVITTVDLIKYMQFFAWQSIYGGGNKQNEKMGTFLVRYRNTGNTGDTGNIIQRDNSAGH